MAMTLSVIVTEDFHLDFWNAIIITQRKRSNHKNVAFSFVVNFFKTGYFDFFYFLFECCSNDHLSQQ